MLFYPVPIFLWRAALVKMDEIRFKFHVQLELSDSVSTKIKFAL
jgi:hypothetical protein